jgi:hypothetical protein
VVGNAPDKAELENSTGEAVLKTLPIFRSKVLWLVFVAGQIAALLLAQLITVQPLFAVAAVYAVGFWVLAWNRPSIALALVFGAAPFQQSLLPSGPLQFSLAEVNLMLMLPVVLLRDATEKRRLHFGPIAAPLALFFLVCLLSSIQSWRGRDALVSLVQMVLYLIIGLLVFSSYARRGEDFLPGLRALIIVGVFLSIVMLVQRTNYVLNLHKNGVGASVACALLVGVELWFATRDPRQRRWLLGALAILVAGLLYSLSRGAWLGCAIGLLWIVAMRGEWKLLLRGAMVFLPLLATAWFSLPQSERQYATGFSRENWNINERYKSVDFAREHWESNPIWGVGVGLREEYDATNIAWSTLAETGVVGLIAFGVLYFVFISSMAGLRHHVARDEVLFSLILIGGALMLRQITHGMVDHYWGRGPLAMSWAAAGMAIFAYSIVQKRRLQNITVPQSTLAGRN